MNWLISNLSQKIITYKLVKNYTLYINIIMVKKIYQLVFKLEGYLYGYNHIIFKGKIEYLYN